MAVEVGDRKIHVEETEGQRIWVSWGKGTFYPQEAVMNTVPPLCSHSAHPWPFGVRRKGQTGAEDTSQLSYEDMNRTADSLECSQKPPVGPAHSAANDLPGTIIASQPPQHFQSPKP